MLVRNGNTPEAYIIERIKSLLLYPPVLLPAPETASIESLVFT